MLASVSRASATVSRRSSSDMLFVGFTGGPLASGLSPLVSGNSLGRPFFGARVHVLHAVLQGVSHAPVALEAVELHAHVDDGACDVRMHPRERALCTEESNGARDAEEVIGGPGVHRLDTRDVDDDVAYLLVSDGLEERARDVARAHTVED